MNGQRRCCPNACASVLMAASKKVPAAIEHPRQGGSGSRTVVGAPVDPRVRDASSKLAVEAGGVVYRRA